MDVESVHILGSQPWPIGEARVQPLLRHVVSHSILLTHLRSMPSLVAIDYIASDILI